MTERNAIAAGFLTHEVTNQPPPLEYDAWTTDTVLREVVAREGGGWAEADLAKYGPVVGGEMQQLAFLANENKPRFRPFDRYGNRRDEVEFHPAYHRLMELGMAHGVSGFAWRNEDKPGAHVARMALFYLHNQADQGTSCPLTMTYASVPALRHQPEVAMEWLPRVSSASYDSRFIPAAQKSGATIGMGMTEKQGGSDVRTNTTKAHRLGEGRGPGQPYALVGHKWFFSAPMSDAFLVLAHAEGGLSCFLMPRFTPDGALNAIRVQRLKDKLGDWSNASSEVELHGAYAVMVGAEGRGVPTILEMVALTRQDCMIGSSGQMRQALVQAIHHTRHRVAFGKRLIDQPLMRNVLADLALELEAHVALTGRVSRAVDATPRDEKEAAFCRIATAVGKYWVCKRTPSFVNEAQECLGGAGYVEETNLPRLYRQAPLNSIWEGSGNIQCLDVLRAASREPASREALFAELLAAQGGHPAYDEATARLGKELANTDSLEARSRTIVEGLALALQASLLIRAGNTAVSDAFCESRLGGAHGQTFGTLPAHAPMQMLIERAFSEGAK
ncbi:MULTISPECIES: isovaleryl-CoA dehydrogenase [Myxococcus]|uniref:Isovaleryl-CoA dehydrogenase n=1 Tax=Myxococcus xanthus TaxID=34 RepID=A0A7Y4INR2_MYXXA|nr:isovaleryl-CoA dehydrogenase [Myxococcus xanthus]NOJ82638.1 isovaleryl-CoA dehydrogenase [Myxococcus xanthus]NOJ90053.1 isovaleryl-CoA dehydrogenase [Myxococcus xanthus]